MTIVRAGFGIFGTYVGIWGIFQSEELNGDVVFATTFFSDCVISITASFFLFESLMVTLSDLYYGGFQILLNMHHWLGLANYVTGMFVGKLHYFACSGLILEMSTPCSAICWTLLKCNKNHLFIWKANQFLLVHLFHVRSVIEMYFWYVTFKNLPYIYNNAPIFALVLMYGGLFLVTFLMTPYWTYRKTQQLINPFDFNFQHPKANGIKAKD